MTKVLNLLFILLTLESSSYGSQDALDYLKNSRLAEKARYVQSFFNNVTLPSSVSDISDPIKDRLMENVFHNRMKENIRKFQQHGSLFPRPYKPFTKAQSKFAYAHIMQDRPRHPRRGGQIYLGMLPSDQLLSELKVNTSILSVVKSFELKGTEDWSTVILQKILSKKFREPTPGVQTRHISLRSKKSKATSLKTHKQIDAYDYHPLNISQIDEGVEFIRRQIDKGNNVFVHCKSGKGRSATIVAAYLIKHKEKYLHDAINYVAQQRKTISNVRVSISHGGHNRALRKYYAAYLRDQL